MRKMKISRLFVFVLLEMFASFLFFNCSDNADSFYKTYNEAEESGHFKGSCAPKILPKSAIDIYERRNIDTNELWIRFNADLKDVEILKKQFRVLTIQELARENVIPYRYPKKWWKPNKENINSFEIYLYNYQIVFSSGRIESTDGYIFIDMKNVEIYYWEPY